MKKFLFCKEKDLILINFNKLLHEIESECLNDLDKFGLIKNYRINLSNRDTKKLIYHHVIHGLCEEVINNKHKYRKAVVIPSRISDEHEIVQFCNPEDFEHFLSKLIKQVQNMLPFVLYKSTKSIFSDVLDDGEKLETFAIISQLCSIKDTKRFTYERIKKFANQFELDFLSQEYFNSIKTKVLLH